MTEETPYACFANVQTREVKGVIGSLEGEEGIVFVGEIAFLAGKGDHILVPHPLAVFAGVAEAFLLSALDGYLTDTGLVGVAGDAVVGDAYGYPYGSLAVLTFADEVHHPHLVGVADREGLAFAAVAVGLYQVGHALDGLAGSLAALQGDVDKASVVDTLTAPEFFAAAPGRLADGELVLVHVADDGVGMTNFRNLHQGFTGVPLVDLTHGTGLMVSGGLELQKSVQRVAVRRVRDKGTTICRSRLTYDKIGASFARHPYAEGCKN